MISPELRAEAETALMEWGADVPEESWGLLDIYLRDVLEYNRKVNLTAARGREELMRRHVLDAWAALAPLKTRCPGSPHLLDVGSGGGFIGIGLKIGWPRASVTLAESVYRKFCFLNWTGAHLGVKGLHVSQERIGLDKRGKGAGKFDAVVARAVAPLTEAVDLLLPAARPGGWALIFQTDKPDPRDESLAKALEAGGGVMEEAVRYRLPREKRSRHLAIVRKRA